MSRSENVLARAKEKVYGLSDQDLIIQRTIKTRKRINDREEALRKEQLEAERRAHEYNMANDPEYRSWYEFKERMYQEWYDNVYYPEAMNELVCLSEALDEDRELEQQMNGTDGKSI